MKSDTCLIVGAGISGLVAARVLSLAGMTVVVVDKASGVGGRMATRRLDHGTADHGAQFFTAKDATFSALLEQATADGVVAPWCDGFPDDQGRFPSDRHLRFRGTPAMTALPKWLASGLVIQLGVTLVTVARHEDGWVATSEDGSQRQAASLLLTAPLPQSLALLDAGNVELPADEAELLRAVAYDPCFALMLRLAGPSLVPAPGALYPFRAAGDEPLSWIADNRRKGTSPEVTVLTVHAGAEFSRKRFADDPAQVERELLEFARPWVGAPIRESRLHRWRYAQTVQPIALPFFRSRSAPALYFAGDGFGSRVEGAALSGARAAAALLAGRMV